MGVTKSVNITLKRFRTWISLWVQMTVLYLEMTRLQSCCTFGMLRTSTLTLWRSLQVDVTLDPATAAAWLLLSPDGKKVKTQWLTSLFVLTPATLTGNSRLARYKVLNSIQWAHKRTSGIRTWGPCWCGVWSIGQPWRPAPGSQHTQRPPTVRLLCRCSGEAKLHLWKTLLDSSGGKSIFKYLTDVWLQALISQPEQNVDNIELISVWWVPGWR